MMMFKKDIPGNIIEEISEKKPEEILTYIELYFGERAAFSTSFGAEDQVITHMIMLYAPSIKIFTLDTGRLFPETYEAMEATNEKYKIKIDIYFPDFKEVEKMTKEKGINLFYNSVEDRKICCQIRKMHSIQRALHDMSVWITGIRKDQSIVRFSNQITEWDDVNQVIKINPLLEWREKDVWEYIKKNKIPYNSLHDKGFPSIGCQPCTRAVKKGEDFRAGRWWWESSEHKECGLHNQKNRPQ